MFTQDLFPAEKPGSCVGYQTQELKLHAGTNTERSGELLRNCSIQVCKRI